MSDPTSTLRPSSAASAYDVVVVGGGLTGLTAAHRLAVSGRRVLVAEAQPEVGGAVRTWRTGDWLFECGPNTVMSRGALEELIAELGLEDSLVVANPEAKRRYIFKGGRLEPLPRGPLSFLRTRLFPWSARFRLLREPWVPPRLSNDSDPAGASQDESVAAFVRRRLGQDWLDYAVGPFTSGVYAGDPERLSVRWAVPKIAALEREHGSLIRGAFAKRSGATPRGRMVTFTEGLATLPLALARQVRELGGEVRLASPVCALEAYEGGYRVSGDGWECRGGQVVITGSATAAAQLVRRLELGGPTAEVLQELPQASLALVSLGYRREQIRHPLDGFGFLAPRCEPLRILGGLFPSSVFPSRAPAGHVALSAFLGGSLDPEIVDADDEEILEEVHRDLDRALGIVGEPVVSHITRWRPAIPQYELGHERFVEAAAALEKANPGVRLAGSYLDGASVPDSVTKGEAVAEAILEALVEATSEPTSEAV